MQCKLVIHIRSEPPDAGIFHLGRVRVSHCCMGWPRREASTRAWAPVAAGRCAGRVRPPWGRRGGSAGRPRAIALGLRMLRF